MPQFDLINYFPQITAMLIFYFATYLLILYFGISWILIDILFMLGQLKLSIFTALIKM